VLPEGIRLVRGTWPLARSEGTGAVTPLATTARRRRRPVRVGHLRRPHHVVDPATRGCSASQPGPDLLPVAPGACRHRSYYGFTRNTRLPTIPPSKVLFLTAGLRPKAGHKRARFPG
jgi:hypothetical protein